VSPTERAEIEYLTAMHAYAAADISGAQAGFTRALGLPDEAEEPNDGLRSDIPQWPSPRYRRPRQRDPYGRARGGRARGTRCSRWS